MKKIILSLFLAALAIANMNAREVYAELLGHQKGLFSNKVKVTVDFGQNVSFWKQGDMTLVDENGKDIVFNSMVDAMNFMASHGWQFVQAYVATVANENVYHWLMKKDVASDEDIKAGFNVRADVRRSDLPSYNLSFVKKLRTSNEWTVVKTETKSLTKEELESLSKEWKDNSNENYEYDVQIKKNK